MSDFTNSPLSDPEFLNSLAVDPNRGNMDFSKSPLANPQFLDETRANEPVRRQQTPAERKAALEREAAQLESRSAGDIISDTLLSGSQAAGAGLLALGGLGLKGVGAAIEAVAPDGSLAQDVGGFLNDSAMVATADMTSTMRDTLEKGKTETAVRSAQIQGEIGQIDDAENLREYEEAVAAGENEFLASLSLYGSQALDTADRVLSDPVATGDLLSQAGGSLVSGSVLSNIGAKVTGAIAGRFGMEGVQRFAAVTAGSAMGMGVTEASSVYVQTVDEVMSRTPQEMVSSELYRNLIQEGKSHEQAMMEVADTAGMDAFLGALPTAMAAGLISAKFNANPLSVMRGENPLGVLITAGKETLEEAVQSGSGQYQQNRAIQDIVDPSQRLGEGVVDAAVLGAIGGFGVSAGLGAGPGIVNGLNEQSERIADQVANERFVQGMGEQIAAQRRADARARMTPEERDADLRAGFTATDPAEELFSTVTGAVRNAVSTVTDVVTNVASNVPGAISAVREAAAPVVDAVVTKVRDYAEAPNEATQNAVVASAQVLSTSMQESVARATPEAPVSPAVAAFTAPSTGSVPEVFKDAIPEGSSLVDTMKGIVTTIAEQKIPVSQMVDDSVLFVAQKYKEMQDLAATAEPAIQEAVKAVLASPGLDRIRKRAARIDLNTTVTPLGTAVGKITDAVKKMTVSMAKLNPTNVNPAVVDEILKQETREDLTPEDVRDLEIAASVTRPMNAYINNIVRIQEDKNAMLVANGAKPDTAENSVEQVSRRLLAGDPSNQEKLPSVKTKVNQIIQGAKAPDQAVDIDGVRVPVKTVAEGLTKLVQHMKFKVEALNESFDLNDEKGVGPSINHDTLVRGKDFIKKDMAGSKSVAYSKRSPNSVTFAKTVGADAAVVAEIHNALVQAFPDLFPAGPVEMPVVKTVEAVETAPVTAEVSNQNTTAVEEVSPAGETDEQTTNTEERDANAEERGVIIKALEQSYPGLKIPNLVIKVKEIQEDINGFRIGATMYNGVMTISPKVMASIMNNPVEKRLHIVRHEFGHFIDFSGEYPVSSRRDWDAAIAEFELFLDTRANDTQKRFLAYINNYKGQDGYAKEVFAELMAIMAVRPLFIQSNMPTAYRVLNEAITEALGPTTAVEDVGLPTSEPQLITDGTGTPLVFYHGTRNEFEQFKEGETFFTTQRGFAKGYALDPNTKKVGRLVAANIRVQNPLMVELPGNGDTDVYWLNNTVRLREGMTDGGFDSVVITNETGDAMVVVKSNSQIVQIADPVVDRPSGVLGGKLVRKVHPKFNTVFKTRKGQTQYENAQQVLDLISVRAGTRTYVQFQEILMKAVYPAMNQRLSDVLVSKSDGRTLKDALPLDSEKLLEIRDFKPLMLVDPETGLYDQTMVDLATMAVVDWMTTARAFGSDRLDIMLDELGLDWSDLSQEQINNLLNSVPTRSTSEQIARKVMKLWGVSGLGEAQMVDIRGTTEGLVKEIFTVLSQMENPVVRLVEIPTEEGRAAAYEISALAAEQEAIGMEGTGSLDKVLFPEESIQASFGTKLTTVDKTQSNKPDVALTPMEQKALKKIQDTPHTEAKPVVEFFQSLGLETWGLMAGVKDSSQLASKHPLRLTIEGKNVSITRDYETAMEMVKAAAGREVFYPVGVTNVGRHQMKGINPQNNKLLRALITPTHSKLDMVNNQKHKNAFWLTVAQSSGLAKVEKKDHKKILSTIQDDYFAKFGVATDVALAWVQTGNLDGTAFAQAMRVANKGEDVSVAQVNAVIAVARFLDAQAKGTLESFETSLSFELDGKTDGPANMMAAFGQGILTRAEYLNFKRVGFFLGSKAETLNTFFGSMGTDLYEENSTLSTKKMQELINRAKGADRTKLMALQRFAAHFGDFEIKPDGSIVMSRATSKNPMTKKVYGSGEKGIAEGIAQDMLIGFYTKLVEMSDGVDLETYLNYPEINEDLNALFGAKFPDALDPNTFILPNASMVPFGEFVKKTIGAILSESTQEIISTKTIEVNDLLVFATNVQGNFMKLYFDQRLAEEMEAEGVKVLRQLSQEGYQNVVKDTLAFAPLYADGNQTLRIGDFKGQVNKTEMSSNLSGNIRSKSTMEAPEDIGVKAIPYTIQGRGDAMMINRIFSADNAPEKAIPIFDGIDMSVADFDGLSDQINEAVLNNWDNDVIGPIADNFQSFLDRVKSMGMGDKLAAAHKLVKTVPGEFTAVDPDDVMMKLTQAHKLNQARKAVFKVIPVAVDHMGGSGKSHVRNGDQDDLSFEQINQMIQDQMDGKTSPNEPVISETPSTLVVSNVATVTDALIRETKPHLRDVVRAIRKLLPDGARIVMGTEAEINQWRQDNLTQSGATLPQRTDGYYDVANNIIFVMSDNHETIVHELIHMATFNSVLAHYQGDQKNRAVKNLEVLMAEFLTLDTSTMDAATLAAYNDTKRAVVLEQAKATPMGDAKALNEFMAWTLASEALEKTLKATPTSLIGKLTKAAKAWIQKVLGVVPTDMYSNILFNTQVIDDNAFVDDDPTLEVQSTNLNENNEVTPVSQNFTNFWLDMLRARLEASKVADGTEKQAKLLRYVANAEDALVQLDFAGFAFSDYQKKTFAAIHTVIAAELQLDPKALLALGKMYTHITENLKPSMFGSGKDAQHRYATLMNLFGATKNAEGVSDSIGVLLALSQTSDSFRKAMDQIPRPAAAPGVDTTSLNDVLSSTTSMLMQKMVSMADTEGKGVKEILDTLSDNIIREDNEAEFKALKSLMGTFDSADKFLGGAMSLLANRSLDLSRRLKAESAGRMTQLAANTFALATSVLDPELSAASAQAAKTATQRDEMLGGAFTFVRELVTEIIGADGTSTEVIQMLDKVNYEVQAARQAFREELPVIFQNEFSIPPLAEEWAALHHVLGKGDFAALFDLKNPDASFDLMNDEALLDRRIKDKEARIMREVPGQTGLNVLMKSKQLADYMNGKGAGFQLWKNAYAIHKLLGLTKPGLVNQIDQLVSLYALKGQDITEREMVAQLQARDPQAVHNLLVYVQSLNKEEDQKIVSEAARMNGYKGYIPDHSRGEVSLIIARDSERDDLERRGYTRVADDKTDASSLVSRGYYMSTTKQAGNYSQGVLQQVQNTYRGVNATTGLTVNGTTSGVISGVAVVTITDALNQAQSVADPKHALIPVMDENGEVLYYERGMDPDLMNQYLQPPSNMAMMVGAWAGRHVEETASNQYNMGLVDALKKIWDNRLLATDSEFIDMSSATDPIYAESWKVIPPQLKDHILEVFGEDGFMVRKDMINVALGYRDPSIVDVWTGNHRLPEAVEVAVKAVAKMTMGDKGFKILANAETITMNTVSTAKDIIVVRSLVVPLLNTQSNVFQLVNLGIGTKAIMKGYRDKFVEIDKFNENLTKIMGLRAQIKLAANNKNRVMILNQQIQVLEDENKRFSIYPLIEAGAYKSISEGMTELDVSITDGKLADWVESKVNKLPAGVQTVVKYGLLSKDTAIYQGANKAVQYGDFIGKSILYDHLLSQGVKPDDAIARVNEEFVNYSILPGRMRTGLESIGATWFLTFKIRSMKTALNMIRNNPARSLVGIAGLGLDSGPITDNLGVKLVEGTLPYSLGWDMLWDAPGMNPWVEVWNG